MAYGDFKDYSKIDIQKKRRDGRWYYICSTTWSNTCADAKAKYLEQNPEVNPETIRTTFKGTPQSDKGRHPAGTEN